MTLTIENFRTEIAPVILERGRQYFCAGRVIDLVEIDQGIWAAKVEGGEVYDVDIEQGTDGELSCACTCPYDWGVICKHIAAVLFAIEETYPEYLKAQATPRLLDGGLHVNEAHSEYLEAKPNEPRKGRQSRAEKVRAILERLSHQELVEILAKLANDDRQLANRLLTRFADENISESDRKKLYIRMVEDALSLGKGRYDYIDYQGARQAADGVNEALSQAEDWLHQKKTAQAIPMLQAIIETVVPAIEHADDSDGALGGCIATAFRCLAEVACQLVGEERRALFEYCLATAPDKRYVGWDWGWDLAHLAANLIATEQERAEVFAMLDQMGSHRQKDQQLASLSDYDLERAALIKLSIIAREGREDEALTFITDHVHLNRFREMLIDYHLRQGKFAEAKRLCNEWLDRHPSGLPGLRGNYLAILLDVARREKDTSEILRLARMLLLETRNIEFFSLLKQAVASGKWPEYAEVLIDDIAQRPHMKFMLAEIYARESMWQKLLSLVEQSGIHLLEEYHKHLGPRFPKEVCKIYESVVFEMLEHTSDRSTYATAAEYLRRMKDLGQGTHVEEIIELLVSTYRNRRAMIEELTRAKTRQA